MAEQELGREAEVGNIHLIRFFKACRSWSSYCIGAVRAQFRPTKGS